MATKPFKLLGFTCTPAVLLQGHRWREGRPAGGGRCTGSGRPGGACLHAREETQGAGDWPRGT